MKIGIKLTIYFFIIASLSMFIIGVIAFYKGKDFLEVDSFNHLTSVREMKATQIENYFKLIDDQIKTFAEDQMIINATHKFKEGFNAIANTSDSNEILKANTNQKNYFDNAFLPHLNKLSKQKANLKDVISLNQKTMVLQNLYIFENSNPLGAKHQMDFAGDSSSYSKYHKQFHPVIKAYLETFGYYDVFIVDNESGNIVYTVFKEIDFGTSLINGPFSNTNLADAFRAARDAKGKGITKMVDFEPYLPSYNAPAAFISAPIYNGDVKIGVLIFQLPIDRINSIMTNEHNWANVGLGKSGETYLVGSDFTLRNQSRFLIEDPKNYLRMIKGIGTDQSTYDKIKNFNSSIGLQEVKTQGTKQALLGKSGAEIFNDYRGVSVLSAYKPLKIKDVSWVIMSEIDEEEAFENIFKLRTYLIYGFCGLIVLALLVSLIISRQMTKPIKELTRDARELAKGNFDVSIDIKRKDEIGVLALSFKKMQISIRNLITDLKDINLNLEKKVAERTVEIQHQKEVVEEKNKEIVDSINYAQRLQKAILPTIKTIKSHLTDSFVLFKPKDIVSGDFYWLFTKGNEIMIAAVDCTGHGVPGAMVSVVGSNSLDRCVKEFGLRKPSDILDKLCDLVIETFETHEHEVKDGMDIALCSIDFTKNTLQFSGAHNPMWIVRHDTLEIEEIKADKQPIGKFDYRKPFNNNEIKVNKGDCIYLFSDGYADQFGGPSGKKFKYKTMQQLLQRIHEKPMEEQKDILNQDFELWKGDLEQVDDVCVIGIRI